MHVDTLVWIFYSTREQKQTSYVLWSFDCYYCSRNGSGVFCRSGCRSDCRERLQGGLQERLQDCFYRHFRHLGGFSVSCDSCCCLYSFLSFVYVEGLVERKETATSCLMVFQAECYAPLFCLFYEKILHKGQLSPVQSLSFIKIYSTIYSN